MHMVIHLEKLEEHARQSRTMAGKLISLTVTQLPGGFVTLGMYRHDLVFQLPDQRIETASYMQKFTSIGEVKVMQALASMPESGAIPRIIDSACHTPGNDDRFAHWFITPFYNGVELTWTDNIPANVIESLAQLHVYFRTRVQQIDEIHRIDESFFRRTFENALEAVARARQKNPDIHYSKAFRQLSVARDNQQLYEALASLPLTLTHGDVHPGNIIRAPDGSAMLIDWGNARIAPAMLDIANMVEINSPTWYAYLTAWEAASKEPMAPLLAQLSYYWATIMVNTQYLPYAVDNTSPEHVSEMVRKVVSAQQKIAGLLSA
jgi:aminoglycoside phosphotransferase (APT) family kinase protein